MMHNKINDTSVMKPMGLDILESFFSWNSNNMQEIGMPCNFLEIFNMGCLACPRNPAIRERLSSKIHFYGDYTVSKKQSCAKVYGQSIQ
jgi:hypothetical protein